MTALRLLHTADWQLGLRAAQLGERGAEVRAERLRALDRMVDLAREQKVDLVVAAGDLFDRSEVDEVVVRAAIAALARLAPARVVLLPGNHDPHEPAGVWSRRAWRTAGEHVAVLTAAEEVEILPGVALYPCPLGQRQSQLDPTGWIPPRAPGDDRLRLGIAHGALASLPGRVNFPIAPDRAEICGLDYLALGDWHGVKVLGRTAYSGTLEQTSFGERLAGWVLVVTLERQGTPRIEQHRVGRLVWRQLDREASTLADVERLAAEIAELGEPETVLLRARIEVVNGDGAVLRELELLAQRLEPSLLYLDWQVSVLQLGELDGDGAFAGGGILSDVDESLLACLEAKALDPQAIPPELAALEELRGASAEELREARVHLRRLLAGVGEPTSSRISR
jgi:hypothetical protein